MQALAFVGAKIGTLFGAGAAGAGALGAAGSAAAASGFGTLSTVLGAVGTVAQLGYQNKVAANNAALMERNAVKVQQASQKSAQEAGLEAAALLGDLTVAQAQTGFAVTSPSFLRVRNKNRLLAQRDQLRIVKGGSAEATNLRNEATSLRNEAGPSPLLGLITGGLDIASSMISGASLVRRNSAMGNNTSARLI